MDYPLEGEKRKATMEYSLEFTGERYLPWLVESDPFIAYEHIHRYLFASTYAKDKRVLDIACGEGYGTAMLAETARFVIGVDNDAATLMHAKKHHGKANISFVQADAQQFRLLPDSLDVVVSFETIEHFQLHEQFLTAIRAALTDDGILFISTPNRAVYNDEDQEDNPFHKRELYRHEFVQLLERHFRHVQLFGQSVMANSMIAEAAGKFILQERTTCDVQVTAVDAAGIEYPVNGESSLRPRYYIAVCSNAELGVIPNNLMVDNRTTLLHSFLDHNRQLSTSVRENGHLIDENAHLINENARLQAIQVDMEGRAQALSAELGGREHALRAELEERAHALRTELDETQQTVAEQARSLDEMRERIETLIKREKEERAAYFAAHRQLLQRDEEILQLRTTGERLKDAIAHKDHEIHTLQQQCAGYAHRTMMTEMARNQSEDARIQAEDARSQTEEARILAEDARAQAEDARAQAELALAEKARYAAWLEERLKYLEEDYLPWKNAVLTTLETEVRNLHAGKAVRAERIARRLISSVRR